MRRIDDTAEIIREIQKKLLLLSYENDAYPKVPVDGVYGTETKNAVEVFQTEHGLSATGTVDYGTFEILCSDCDRVKNEKTTKRVQKGDSGEDVELLHLLLHRKSIPRIRSTYFGEETEKEVRDAQKEFELCETGIADDRLFSLLWERKMLDGMENGM